MAGNGPPVRRRIGPGPRREQILAVAARHFEERSYSAVSTGAIADDAGVGRPLIHYYFGTKRELYLEVVRRFALVPPYLAVLTMQSQNSDSLEDRVRASIEHWLSLASRHRSMWTSTIRVDARDLDIQRIIEEADDIAADRLLESFGLDEHVQRQRLHAMFLAFGGMARGAGSQWLVRKTLSRNEVADLLTLTLLTIIRDVVPRLTP